MKPKLTAEIRSDPNGGHTAVIYPALDPKTLLHRTKRHATQAGAVDAARIWADDNQPAAKLQFVYVFEV